jgi:hypothetical protein
MRSGATRKFWSWRPEISMRSTTAATFSPCSASSRKRSRATRPSSQRPGRTISSRLAAASLHAAGLHDYIASDPGHYIGHRQGGRSSRAGRTSKDIAGAQCQRRLRRPREICAGCRGIVPLDVTAVVRSAASGGLSLSPSPDAPRASARGRVFKSANGCLPPRRGAEMIRLPLLHRPRLSTNR